MDNSPQRSDWDEVRELIDAGDSAGIVRKVAALDEVGRKEVAGELPGYIAVAWDRECQARADWDAEQERAMLAEQEELRRLRDAGEISEERHHQLWAATWNRGGYGEAPRWDGWIDPMRLAGAGTIGGAAAVVAWINNRRFDRWNVGRATDLLLEVIAARPTAWQADLAVRLALKVRRQRQVSIPDPNLAPALGLLRRTKVVPPAHDPLVTGWVAWGVRLDELRDDPLLDHLLPRLFETEGVGRLLSGDPGSWSDTLCALAAEGRVDRGALLDGCRRRFLLGGDGRDLRFFVRLHEQLAPTPAEIRPHTVDYVRLLPAAPGPVAEMALKHVRRLPGFDPGEAVEGLLFRTEGGLVRAGLSWFEEVVRLEPHRADEFAPALAVVFGHRTRAVQERAVRLARYVGPGGVEVLRDSAGMLPPELYNRLVAVIGGERVEEPEPEPEPEEVLVPGTLPVPPGPVPLVAPPRSPAELAAIYPEKNWRQAERALAAFVRLAALDREGLREAVAPFARPRARTPWPRHHHWLAAFAAVLVTPDWAIVPPFAAMANESRREDGLPPMVFKEPDLLPGPHGGSPPHLFLLRRYAEILDALRSGTLPPLLLATPTLSNGLLDPAELVTRLESLELAGFRPLPADFQQALLRLPREIDPAVAVRAGGLVSEEGRAAARWMAEGGLPDPEVRVTWSGEDDGQLGRVWMAVAVHAEPTGLPLVDELLAAQPLHVNAVTGGHLGEHMDWWAAVLPAHREVVAAHLVAHQPIPDWSVALPTRRLADLADTTGPAGRAVAVLLAHRFLPDDPNPARWVFRRFAATGGLPAEEFGEEFAARVLRGEITLRALVNALAEESMHGTHEQVWRALTTALPLLLPAPGARPTAVHTDLVALAARLARWSAARGEIPAVTALAARKSSSRISLYARALHEQLTGERAAT
ncbi:DUF6493 family protein [Nonomuraea sp. NPDC046570]|uniref:DUF6493 family protein n=1 Tax=Nonomuraea sp. NPDC046570 TaxID=3155255 RepID=UPI0033EACFFF